MSAKMRDEEIDTTSKNKELEEKNRVLIEEIFKSDSILIK